MAIIKELRALRFSQAAGNPQDLVCPPYGDIGEEERLRLCGKSPHNIVRLELPREGRDPYERASYLTESWLDKGILVQDETPGIYLYERSYTAEGEQKRVLDILCRVRLEEPESGVILPNEAPGTGFGTDRFNLLCATRCNISPVHALFHDYDGAAWKSLADRASGEPLTGFADGEGIIHKVWKIEDRDKIEEIRGLIAAKTLYIADGRRRYEAALRYRDHLRRTEGDAPREADWILMALTSMEQPDLTVLPVHRVIRDVDGFDPDDLLEELGRWFSLQRIAASELPDALENAAAHGEKAMGLCLPDASYMMTIRDIGVMKELLPGAGEVLRKLDASILHSLVLERLMGIEREDTDSRRHIFFVGSASEAALAVENGSAACAFLLNPVTAREIAAIADAGETAPPGSARFYPSPATGIIMARL